MFTIAESVYSKKYLNEMNVSFFIPIDYEGKEITLTIAGQDEYQVFLNGKLVLYGPAKATHNYHRIDEIKLTSTKEKNRLLILVAGYNCESFDRFKQIPFIKFEVSKDNKVIASSSLNTVCYKNEMRYQKVARFSYQRQFSESYNDKYTDDIYKYGTEIKFGKVELTNIEPGEFLSRNVHYPNMEYLPYEKVQEESVTIDENAKIFDTRYFWTKELRLFDQKDWEYDANKLCSQFVLKEAHRDAKALKTLESTTFANKVSQTGFINTKVLVKKPSTIFIYFDEVNTSETDLIDFKFYRNETQNLISYELKEGEYDLISCQPCTAKYIRVVCVNGEIEVNSIGVILLENPDSYNLSFSFEDKRIEKIFEAARNTFASNAVDILTDCPSRERAGWLCDSYFSSRSEMLFTGKNLVETNFLENYALYKEIPGVVTNMIPMCYPASFGCPSYIPNWSMWYVLELKNFMRRNNNQELLKKSMHNIEGLLEFFKGFENDLGLLEDLKGWVFVEWSFANSEEAIRGVNIPCNALYASFLECIGEMFNRNELIEHALKIRKWIKENAFNGTYFVDNLVRDKEGKLVLTNHTGETTQYYVLYFNVVEKDEISGYVDFMLNEFGPNRDVTTQHPESYKSNMIVGNFLRLELMNRYGLYEKTLSETIDYFSKMADITGTLWEHDSIFASLNHGFASFVANIITEAVSGLSEIDYINKVVKVRETSYKGGFEISIPANDEKIIIKGKDGKVTFTCPEGYKVVKA